MLLGTINNINSRPSLDKTIRLRCYIHGQDQTITLNQEPLSPHVYEANVVISLFADILAPVDARQLSTQLWLQRLSYFATILTAYWSFLFTFDEQFASKWTEWFLKLDGSSSGCPSVPIVIHGHIFLLIWYVPWNLIYDER